MESIAGERPVVRALWRSADDIPLRRSAAIVFKRIKLINKWYYDGHVRRSVASAAVRGLERHLRDAPPVDAGHRESSARSRAAAQSFLVHRDAGNVPRTLDADAAPRRPHLQHAIRFHRSPTRD